ARHAGLPTAARTHDEPERPVAFLHRQLDAESHSAVRRGPDVEHALHLKDARRALDSGRLQDINARHSIPRWENSSRSAAWSVSLLHVTSTENASLSVSSLSS